MKLNPSHRLVMLRFTNKWRQVSYALLAEETGLSMDRCFVACKELIQGALIEKLSSGRGRGQINQYRLTRKDNSHGSKKTNMDL